MELGMRNQHQIQHYNKTLIPASVNAIQSPLVLDHRIGQSQTTSTNKAEAHLYIVRIVAETRSQTIAMGKTCNNCGLLNHFDKVCRKQKSSNPQKPKKRTVNMVDKEPHPEDSVNFLQSSKLGNISTTPLVDSESACSFINLSIASQVVKTSQHAFWVRDNANPQLRTISNEPICIKGKIQTTVACNGWTACSATFTVVADCLKSLIGRDLFDQLGLALTQRSSSSGNQVNTISPYGDFKESIAFTFPNLIFHIGRSKNHVANLKFHKNV